MSVPTPIASRVAVDEEKAIRLAALYLVALKGKVVFGNKVFLRFWKNTAVFSNTAVLYT
jgi:hypothetical protein